VDAPKVERPRVDDPRTIRAIMPWHKGWLGSITVINGNTEFTLGRRQFADYVKSHESRGGTVEYIDEMGEPA
jgi:hypothetical protein